VNAKRFAYAAALLTSALWIGTATLLSVAPGGPTVAESDAVVAQVRGAVLEQPETPAEVETPEVPAVTPPAAVDIAPAPVEPAPRKLTKKVVATPPPSPAPPRSNPALRLSFSGGPLALHAGVAGTGLVQVDVNAGLGWLALL
jgi:hypothetical protein